MANPMPNEDKIYERLVRDKVVIDNDVRELLNHHIRNDLNGISTYVGEYEFVPPWILKFASWIIKTLCLMQGLKSLPYADLISLYKGTMKRSKNIVAFLNKLMEATDNDDNIKESESDD